MAIQIEINRDEIVEFCQRWNIVEFSFFGSVLRDDFRPDSDVDILVSFANDSHWGLFDICRMEEQLADIFGRKVDLVTRKSVESSENYIRRQNILNHMETVLAER